MNDPFAIALQPGSYKFQLVACGRFFMGWEDEELRDARWKVTAEHEEARSEAVSIQVTERRQVPKEAESETDEPQLLCRLDIEEVAPGEERTLIVQPACRYVLTLSNLSRSRSIGVIDPFSQELREFGHPVRWISRSKRGKLEILRSGDPEIGWRLGKSYPNVIHPDSVLERRVIVEVIDE